MFFTRRYAWSLDQLVSGQLLLRNADFVARYLSTVTSDETRSTHFTMELLCLREHSWEFSNNSTNSMFLSVFFKWTMLNGCTGKCVRLSRPLVGF